MSNMDLLQIKNVLQTKSPEVYGFADLYKYGILVPIVEQEGNLHVLFEVRAHHLKRQPGEICFPGGKVDPEDINEQAAAVRETSEELGIDIHAIEVLGNLGVLVPPYQIALYTYVGHIKTYADIAFNQDEVAEIFTVPLEFVLHTKPQIHQLRLGLKPDEHFPYEHIPGGKDYKFRERQIPEYFYFYEGRVIWGLTARILYQFVEKVKEGLTSYSI